MDHNVINLIKIQKEIQLKVSESNNRIKMPEIVAVSKTFSISNILPVINYGQIHFGENKVQEAEDKWVKLKEEYNHVKLHMVGKLQSNKAKKAVKLFDYIHSLDNKKLANKISLEQTKLNLYHDKYTPFLVKISPDVNNEDLDNICRNILKHKVDGVIATNTTIDRDGLKIDKNKLMAIGNGGLSGKPLKEKSTKVIRYLADKSNKAFPIIGVGGIHSSEDAIEKLDAGAALVQLYTGFIYEGPGLSLIHI